MLLVNTGKQSTVRRTVESAVPVAMDNELSLVRGECMYGTDRHALMQSGSGTSRSKSTHT